MNGVCAGYGIPVVSPHLLSPFTSRQLGLVHGDDRVVVFCVHGGRTQGTSTLAHAPTLIRRVETLGQEVDLIAFVDGPVPDGATVALVDDMVEELDASDADALARHVPVTEAVKRVEGDLVVEAVDRSSLVSLRFPEIVRRAPLERAMSQIGSDVWVNPCRLVAAAGGRIALYGLTAVEA